MALLVPKRPTLQSGIFVISLAYLPQVTVDVADAAVKALCPFPATVIAVVGRARALGGTPHTDVDVTIYKNTTLIATVPIVDGSALGTGGSVVPALTGTGAELDLDGVDDFLHMKLIDITGGSTPTLDGLVVDVYLVRRG